MQVLKRFQDIDKQMPDKAMSCKYYMLYLPRESAILARFLFALEPLVEVLQSHNVPRWKAENIPDILRGVATISDKKYPQ